MTSTGNRDKRSRHGGAPVQQEAHIWQRAIECAVPYLEVAEILRNVALINPGTCARTRMRDVYETLVLPYLRTKIPLGGGRVENESGREEREGTDLVVIPALSERGAQRDHLSFVCDHNPARVYGKPGKPWEDHCRVEHGVVLDRCFLASEYVAEDAREETRETQWEPRPLPLTCVQCEVTCDSYAAFTEHCALFAHKQALAAAPLAIEWVDPRLLADVELELHELPRAVVAWRDRVLTVFRTIDDAGMACLASLVEQSKSQMEDPGPRYEWWDRENAEWTAEKAHQIILKSYVLNDFHEFGLWPGGGESYPMMIINEGWSAFDFFTTWDWRQFNIQMADNGAGNYGRACRDG